MQNFVRMTKLSDVVGRCSYIRNKQKQEEILLDRVTDAVENVGWKAVAEFERTHRRSNKANNQARELIIQLPNEWADLPQAQLIDAADSIAAAAIDKDLPMMEYAVHWNHNRTNLHMHLIFSERSFIGTPQYYDRDVYLTSDGRVARRKADRAIDSQGNILPPVHRKGDCMGNFGPKDSDFKEHSWIENARQRVAAEYVRLGVQLTQTKSWLLHQYHQGKGSDSALIAAKNASIRVFNSDMIFLYQQGLKSSGALQSLRDAAIEDLRQGKAPKVHGEIFGVETGRKISELLQSHRFRSLSERIKQSAFEKKPNHNQQHLGWER